VRLTFHAPAMVGSEVSSGLFDMAVEDESVVVELQSVVSSDVGRRSLSTRAGICSHAEDSETSHADSKRRTPIAHSQPNDEHDNTKSATSNDRHFPSSTHDAFLNDSA
jgi:hypothetical protein